MFSSLRIQQGFLLAALRIPYGPQTCWWHYPRCRENAKMHTIARRARWPARIPFAPLWMILETPRSGAEVKTAEGQGLGLGLNSVLFSEKSDLCLEHGQAEPF